MYRIQQRVKIVRVKKRLEQVNRGGLWLSINGERCLWTFSSPTVLLIYALRARFFVGTCNGQTDKEQRPKFVRVVWTMVMHVVVGLYCHCETTRKCVDSCCVSTGKRRVVSVYLSQVTCWFCVDFASVFTTQRIFSSSTIYHSLIESTVSSSSWTIIQLPKTFPILCP